MKGKFVESFISSYSILLIFSVASLTAFIQLGMDALNSVIIIISTKYYSLWLSSSHSSWRVRGLFWQTLWFHSVHIGSIVSVRIPINQPECWHLHQPDTIVLHSICRIELLLLNLISSNPPATGCIWHYSSYHLF